MSKFHWITTEAALADLTETLLAEPSIAVDTESNSLYSYFERVCLVQISTMTQDFIVDPLAVDITPVGVLFSNPDIQKIFHAAEYDLISLKRDYGFRLHNLFDTMIAARILGWSKFGLGNVLRIQFGVMLKKQFQQYNWGQRPLSPEALEYARLDTHYLHELRTVQQRELAEQGRLKEAAEAFARATVVRVEPKIFESTDFWSIRRAKDLKPRQQGLLEALYVFRDRVARETNRPPFRIMSDATLVRLAKKQPRTLDSMKRIKGVGPAFVRRYGQAMLPLLKAPARQATPYVRSSNNRPSEAVWKRYQRLRSWRNLTAGQRGVEPDVIMSNDVLMRIAQANPATIAQLEAENILGNWQFDTYSRDIIDELTKLNGRSGRR